MTAKIHWQLINLNSDKVRKMERLRTIYEALDAVLVEIYADPRLMAIARSQLELSLMAANKAVAVHNVSDDKIPHDETTE